jgi:hypothetical protein
MVDPAIIQAVAALEKDAALVIGMDHIDLAPLFILFNKLLKGGFPELTQGGVNPDMTSHLLDKFHLIALKQNFFVFFTTGSALTAVLKNSLEIRIIEAGYGYCHDLSLLSLPPFTVY